MVLAVSCEAFRRFVEDKAGICFGFLPNFWGWSVHRRVVRVPPIAGVGSLLRSQPLLRKSRRKGRIVRYVTWLTFKSVKFCNCAARPD